MSLTSGDKRPCAMTRRSAASAKPRRLRLERSPAFEGAEKPCRDLRVLLVKLQHDRRDEIIAAAVRRIELGLVAGREGADQGAERDWGSRARRPGGS